MAMWNPWRGCHRYSEGCRYCYIHKGDAKRGVNTDEIIRSGNIGLPLERYVRGKSAGEYKIKPGETVYLCFSSDFLLEDADPWRDECWDIIKQRGDLNFLFLTKRIERFAECVPPDWGGCYDNVTVGCTVENQKTADARLAVFDSLPIKHKNIICQPMLENISLAGHLAGTELVVVGGEYGTDARPLNYDWVLAVREECIRAGVRFNFRQCGTNFIRDGVLYRLNYGQLSAQAHCAGIDT